MAGDPAHTPFAEQLAALRREYAWQLPEKIRSIEATWEMLQQGQGHAELLEAMHLMVHRLAGSGASYGFTAVTETAQRLEMYLQSLAPRGAPPTAEQRGQINAYLGALKEAVLAADPSAAPTTRERGAPAAPSPASEADKQLVFLLADDPLLAQYLALQLGDFGYTTRTFTQLAALQQAAPQLPPAAMIMDMSFAEGDRADVETIAAIRRSRATSAPVIFLSAAGDLAARIRAVRAGADAMLTKPLDLGRLFDTLNMLTAQKARPPYRILIVEDDSLSAAHYAAILQQAGMTTAVVTDPMQAMKPLLEFNPDLILLDMYMPGCNGLELTAAIRQMEAYIGIPIVFLSVETQRHKQWEAMHLGADEFLTKPIQPDHLIAVVTNRAQRARTIRVCMVRDSLTGLFNQATIKEQLAIEVARATRRNSKLAFAVIDIDHFSAVHATYGHPVGDRLLQSLSRLLQQSLRKTDIIGRYGGEAFAVILPDTDGPTALSVLDKLRLGFARARHGAEGGEFSVTCSCGIAALPSYGDATRLDDAAVRALYAAKQGGRNRTCLQRP